MQKLSFTSSNYFERLNEIDVKSLPLELRKGYDYVKEVTSEHKNWDYYNVDPEISMAVNEYFANLTDFLFKSDNTSEQLEAKAHEWAKEIVLEYFNKGYGLEFFKKNVQVEKGVRGLYAIHSGDIFIRKIGNIKVKYSYPAHSIYNELIDAGLIKKKSSDLAAKNSASKKKKGKVIPGPRPTRKVKNSPTKPVERIEEEVKFIKRFTLLNGKTKTEKQILLFINSLQKAIIERRIRKTSQYAVQIGYIQSALIKAYNEMGQQTTIKINDDTLEDLQLIAGSQQVRLTTNYIKRYIGLQGKTIDKEKARKLIALIQTAIKKQKIDNTDPYYTPLQRIQNSLKIFISKGKPLDTLKLHNAVLNGIQAALDGCCANCDNSISPVSLEGISTHGDERIPDDKIINSLDFAKMTFESLGFTGVWKEFLGDPHRGFTAMLSSFPKFGKSTLCAIFAGYLAREHGETLLVANEEKAGQTLQQKLKSVAHQSLFIVGNLPNDLSPFDFVILDSVNRLGLLPEDLRALKVKYPHISFIFVFQVTKNGKFRGSNEMQHDVDMVIEIPEKGRAVQYGRFNQGGEMVIFETPPNKKLHINSNNQFTTSQNHYEKVAA